MGKAVKLKQVGGRHVSAKSKTGDPTCSAAVSAWVLGRKAHNVAKAVYETLARCRQKASQNRKAHLQQLAGKLATGRGTWQRSEQAMALKQQRAQRRAAPVSVTTRTRTRPEPTYEANPQHHIVKAFEGLRPKSHAGMVPIHEVRAQIARTHGAHAASHEVFDKHVLAAHRAGKLKILPLNDKRGIPTEHRLAGIPTKGEEWFYLDRPNRGSAIRSEQAQALKQQRASRVAATHAPARPTLREQAAAHRAGKGTAEQRLSRLEAIQDKRYKASAIASFHAQKTKQAATEYGERTGKHHKYETGTRLTAARDKAEATHAKLYEHAGAHTARLTRLRTTQPTATHAPAKAAPAQPVSPLTALGRNTPGRQVRANLLRTARQTMPPEQVRATAKQAKAPEAGTFAEHARKAAAAVPWSKRFGDNKAFIHHAHEEYARTPEGKGVSLEEFKSRLVKSHAAGNFMLGRADMVEAMLPTDVAKALSVHHGAEYHLIRIDPKYDPKLGASGLRTVSPTKAERAERAKRDLEIEVAQGRAKAPAAKVAATHAPVKAAPVKAAKTKAPTEAEMERRLLETKRAIYEGTHDPAQVAAFHADLAKLPSESVVRLAAKHSNEWASSKAHGLKLIRDRLESMRHSPGAKAAPRPTVASKKAATKAIQEKQLDEVIRMNVKGMAAPNPAASAIAARHAQTGLSPEQRRMRAEGIRGARKAFGPREATTMMRGKPAAPAPAPKAPAPPTAIQHSVGGDVASHAAEIHRAQQRIDEAQGKEFNFVSLHEMRESVPHLSREQFDKGLHHLRTQGKMSLTFHEGVKGTPTPQQLAAGIPETAGHGGTRTLIYASRLADAPPLAPPPSVVHPDVAATVKRARKRIGHKPA